MVEFSFSGVVSSLGIENILTKEMLFNAFGFFFLLIFSGIILGFLLYYLNLRKRFKYKIVVFQKVGGNIQVVEKDTAEEIDLAPGSICFYMRKRKKHMPRPTKQSGLRTYWYYIKENGDWVNTSLSDFDKETQKLSFDFDDSDMRHSRAALQKLLRDNYKKEKWWERFAPYIALAILILMLGVAAWLISGRLMNITDSISDMLRTTATLSDTNREILSALDNLCSTSGIRPAG